MVMKDNLQILETELRAALSGETDIPVDQMLTRTHPADIADVLERLPADDSWRLFLHLEIRQGADVLYELGREAIRRLFREMTDVDIAHYLNAMPMDEVADILSHDVPERQEALLGAMRAPNAREVRKLIGYPPDSAGRLMTEKFVQLKPDMPAVDVLDYLRRVDPEVETVTDLYVTSVNGTLQGVVSLREAVAITDPDISVRAVMIPNLVTVKIRKMPCAMVPLKTVA
jgi:magnesium transporter